MEDIGAWAGTVRQRADDFDSLRLVTPSPAGGSFSSPFRGGASDGEDYFVKALSMCPAGQERTLAVEQIVAAAGALIGAPVCHVSLIRIPASLATYEPSPGRPLGEGLAHASRALEHADEAGRPYLGYRQQDDNARRHVGIYALFDWCWGADPQWLYDIDEDRTLYSHDHGLYLPQWGGWNRIDLQAHVNAPHPLPDDPNGLDASQKVTIASALEAVKPEDLIHILNKIPASWPISNDDLEAVGWFLFNRAAQVAARIRIL